MQQCFLGHGAGYDRALQFGGAGARSRFAGACTGGMPLSTARPCILPEAAQVRASTVPGGSSVPAGLGCHTLAWWRADAADGLVAAITVGGT